MKPEEMLRHYKAAYYTGQPLITDDEYDALVHIYGEVEVGYVPKDRILLPVRMYSLKKIYEGEDDYPDYFALAKLVETPKLDGAALQLLYVHGKFKMALTRGDGTYGMDVTEQAKPYVPQSVDTDMLHFIVCGEMVLPSSVDNARNVVSGYLARKNMIDDLPENPVFFAYDTSIEADTYCRSLEFLEFLGFNTVFDDTSDYPKDGKVVRIDSNVRFKALGYTSKHPRGAVAVKKRTAGVPTTLLDVVWDAGRTGKVTPVAILEPIMIDGAKVSRATLNNPEYMEALGVTELGCTVYVERSGGIIPRILRVEQPELAE